MPVIKGGITVEGGLIKVSVGWSAAAIRNLRLAGKPVPAPVEASALIDTGAEVSCLDTKIIEELELPAEGPVLANVPNMPEISFAYQHDASLTILHPSGNRNDHLIISDLPLMELSLNVLGYQAIIGRDILAKCYFLYNGIGERFAIKY